MQQIAFNVLQLSNTQFLKESYKLATKQPFGHLLIDLAPKTSNALRYCSNIVPPGSSIFYLRPAKAVITNITNEKERTIYAAAIATSNGYRPKKQIKAASEKIVQFLYECFLNVVNGNVSISSTLIEITKLYLEKFYRNRQV